MAAALRKIADKIEGKDKEPNNPQSSNFGPHSSAAANKLDPTIDSDRDGRNDPSSTVGGYGNTQTHTTATGVVGGPTHNTTGIGHPASTGPHNSNLANKLDPRVDTDPTYGSGYGTHQTTATHNTTHSSGLNPLTGNHGQSTNAGPHNSNLANKLDPRVDSDLGNTHPGQGAAYTTPGGYTGTNTAVNHPNSTNVGPHSNNLLNKLDPRVDSDVDGRNNPASGVGGYGQTQNTSHVGGVATHGTHASTQGYTGTNVAHDDPRSTNTGPHSSNLLNKLDPRVDSDRDGRNDPTSRTGGYGQTQTGTTGVGRY